MQIKIEIDVKPEELRRFLGLPDVAGLQEDVIGFLRDKVGAAGEFDTAAFLKGNFEGLRKSPAWQRLLAAARMRVDNAPADAATPRAEPVPEKPPAGASRRSGGSARRATARTSPRSRRPPQGG